MVTTYTGKMDWQLDAAEARVLGSLLEKEITTPDYYPLSLNALVNACNQKSNRDPVVSYDEDIVETALEALRVKGLRCGRRAETAACRSTASVSPRSSTWEGARRRCCAC